MADWTVLACLLPALLVAIFCPLQAATESTGGYASASCFRKETYNITSRLKVQVPVNKTRYDWCLGGFMRCVVYKVEMAEKEINVTEIKSRIVEMCCPGMIPAPGTPAQTTNDTLQCIPVPGSQLPPVTTPSTTTIGTTTREVCKTGLWGRGCSHTCLCGGASCNQDTGTCLPCSPNDGTCESSATSTTVTTTSTTTTSPVPTTLSSTPSTTTSTTPTVTTTAQSTTTSTPSTTSSITMISTLATMNTSTQRTVETPLRVTPSNASKIPVAASTESPRTVSITSPITRLAQYTTVRPVVVTREQSTIERRKEASGKSFGQSAKTTAQPIDPEAVNRVDISPGNGKPKPNIIPTNTSSINTPPPPTATAQTSTSPSTHPAYPTSTLAPSSARLSTIHKAPNTSTTSTTTSTTTTTTTTTLKPELGTKVQTTSTTQKPLPNQSIPKTDDTSSEESNSDEGDDDEDDDGSDDEDEEDLENMKDFKLHQETVLSPPGKPATRIDKIQTKINNSQHLMTWTFQTDFSVGPPIKLVSPPPRKNAIPSDAEDRNSSVLLLDKISDDKIVATTMTYNVNPWMPALNLATEAPILNEQTRNTVSDRNRTSSDKTTKASLSTAHPLPSKIVSTTTTPMPPTITTLSTTSTTQTSTLRSTTVSAEAERSTLKTNTEAPAVSSSHQNTTLSLSTTTKHVEKIAAGNSQNKSVSPSEAGILAYTVSQLTSIVTGSLNTEQYTTPLAILPTSMENTQIETSTKTNEVAPNTTVLSYLTTFTNHSPTSGTSSTQTPAYLFPTISNTSNHSTTFTSTTLKVPPVTIPTGIPPVSVQTVISSTVRTTSTTLGLTTQQGHIIKSTVSRDQGHFVTSPRSIHDIGQLGSPLGDPPSTPSAAGSGAAGVAIAAIAIALATVAILCVVVIFVQTQKRRSKRRPGVIPPPSPPLISAWHSEPHYSDTFVVNAPAQRTSPPASPRTSPFSEQFHQPAVEHVYQEITPLAIVIETSAQTTDSNSSTRETGPLKVTHDTGPTKVMVKLRNVETYVVR